MALSEADQARCRYHLGYPEIDRQYVKTTGLEFSQNDSYIIESIFDQVTDRAVVRVQTILRRLDATETRLEEAQDRLAVSELEGIKLRTGRAGESEPDLLRKEYSHWGKRLASVLACPVGPGFQDYDPASAKRSVVPRYIS